MTGDEVTDPRLDTSLSLLDRTMQSRDVEQMESGLRIGHLQILGSRGPSRPNSRNRQPSVLGTGLAGLAA